MIILEYSDHNDWCLLVSHYNDYPLFITHTYLCINYILL